jgi:hypothetical protein
MFLLKTFLRLIAQTGIPCLDDGFSSIGNLQFGEDI